MTIIRSYCPYDVLAVQSGVSLLYDGGSPHLGIPWVMQVFSYSSLLSIGLRPRSISLWCLLRVGLWNRNPHNGRGRPRTRITRRTRTQSSSDTRRKESDVVGEQYRTKTNGKPTVSSHETNLGFLFSFFPLCHSCSRNWRLVWWGFRHSEIVFNFPHLFKWLTQ